MAMLNNQMVPFRDGLYNRSPKSVNLKQIHLGIWKSAFCKGIIHKKTTSVKFNM